MAGITAMGTTYTLPNYTGILYALTPADTPIFSATGGLSGGRQTTSTEFEWQTYDLGSAAQTTVVEGATAPTAEGRVRANVTNVCQIQQRKVSVSYTKLAAVGLKAGSNNDLSNPVTNELDWQVEQALKGMVRDIEYSFINGTYQKPSDNNTARQTRGLLAAVTTNKVDYGTSIGTDCTATAATNKIGKTSHGLSNDDRVIVTAKTNGAGITLNRVYFVVNKGTNDFEISAVKGGPAVDITSDGTSLTVVKAGALTYDMVAQLLQSVYDSGGIMESETATLVVPSHLRVALSSVLANAFGKFYEQSRTVGGVAFSTVVTDFGTLNVMTNRHMPQGKLLVLSMEQIAPVFLEIPGKGHFFAEPLAKTGASDDVQLYGEVGLAYGNEASHGQLLNVG